MGRQGAVWYLVVTFLTFFFFSFFFVVDLRELQIGHDGVASELLRLF